MEPMELKEVIMYGAVSDTWVIANWIQYAITTKYLQWCQIGSESFTFSTNDKASKLDQALTGIDSYRVVGFFNGDGYDVL